MTRKSFIGANIKMNPLPGDLDAYRATGNAEVVIFPSALDLQTCIAAKLAVGAQWGHPDEKGAVTGDISMAMLKNAGVSHVLCGHSERRRNHAETDPFISKQVSAALKSGLIPILCIGETEEEHKAGKTNQVIQTQLANAQLSSDAIVAYEPVWAIGTGKTPTKEEIQTIHAFIRSLLPHKEIRILYGGSVTAENAKNIFGCTDVDGALVGGASLDPKGFKKIVEAAR